MHVDPRRAGFAIAFGIGAVGFLFLVTAVALGLSSMYSNRVLPGVRVGSIDVSGMSRDEVIAKLESTYAYLGQGQVTVTTPVGASTITYQQAGRGPDVEAMADAAMSIGHTGNPIGDTASIVRSAIAGQSIPVVVDVDPMALATRVHQLVGSSQVPPQDAQVTISSGTFTFSPSASGQGIDEKAISSAIIERLTQPDAPADLQAGGKYVALDPQVSDKDAQDAIAGGPEDDRRREARLERAPSPGSRPIRVPDTHPIRDAAQDVHHRCRRRFAAGSSSAPGPTAHTVRQRTRPRCRRISRRSHLRSTLRQ